MRPEWFFSQVRVTKSPGTNIFNAFWDRHVDKTRAAGKGIFVYPCNPLRDMHMGQSYTVGKGILADITYTLRDNHPSQAFAVGKGSVSNFGNVLRNHNAGQIRAPVKSSRADMRGVLWNCHARQTTAERKGVVTDPGDALRDDVSVSPLQNAKADSPISVTPSGISSTPDFVGGQLCSTVPSRSSSRPSMTQ